MPATIPDIEAPRPGAEERILRATANRIAASGAVKLAMQDVADDAGVSKGLIHYHFHDKSALLARLVEWLASGLVARERGALTGATPQTVIDALWRWMDDELERGDVRVLVELARYDAEPVRAAVLGAGRVRRETARGTIETLFGVLGLRPRLPPALLADVAVTFLDGLAIDAGRPPDAPRRAAFDVFWLSLLSLTE
jgi:AcrR family transcriptional regulator